jgi:hypothetical protein
LMVRNRCATDVSQPEPSSKIHDDRHRHPRPRAARRRGLCARPPTSPHTTLGPHVSGENHAKLSSRTPSIFHSRPATKRVEAGPSAFLVPIGTGKSRGLRTP